MRATYFISTPHLHTSILPLVIHADWSPTLHYYGRVILEEPVCEPEAVGLWPLDEYGEDVEAEAEALYDAEMGYMP